MSSLVMTCWSKVITAVDVEFTAASSSMRADIVADSIPGTIPQIIESWHRAAMRTMSTSPQPVIYGAVPEICHPSAQGSARRTGGPWRRRCANATPPRISPRASPSAYRWAAPSQAAVADAGPACCCQMNVEVRQPPARASITKFRSPSERFEPPTASVEKMP